MHPRHSLYLGLGLMAGVLAVFLTPSRFKAPELDCIIQSDQVILNMYDRQGDLRQSINIAGSDVTSWRKGQVKPVVRKNQQIWKNTHSQNSEGQWLISVYTGTNWDIYGYASPECYDAIAVIGG